MCTVSRGDFEKKTTIQRGCMEAQRTRFYFCPTLWGPESDEFTLERWDYISANASRANGKGLLEDYSIQYVITSASTTCHDSNLSQ